MATHHRVYFADSRSFLRNVPSNSVQLVVTSPPYWNARNYARNDQIGFGQSFEDYSKDLQMIWRESVRTLFPDGKIAVNVGNIYYDDGQEKRRITANLMNLVWNQLFSFEELRFMGTIYWEKSTSRNHKVLMGSYPYPSAFLISTALEGIFVFRKKGYRKVEPKVKEDSKITKEEFREFRQPFWRLNGIHNGTNHPAPFPRQLPSRLIRMYSFKGDTILDPFLGSGSTLIEAIGLGRNSIGIEVNRAYFRSIRKFLFDENAELGKYSCRFHNAEGKLFSRIINGRITNAT